METLAISLIKAETEREVIDILKKHKYWDNTQDWKYYGDIENNFSIIGNQQSSADTALVEKLVNSIDAVLISECLQRGIHPESPEAPESLKDAIEDFFHVYGGSLSNIDVSQRGVLADKIKLVATGYKSRPTLTIIDEGEGQYPEDFPDTFLSLAKSNKIKIPFVQGKFNMGGSGVLQFCGEHNLQLIVSKKNTLLGDSKWGFTIVRRQQPSQGMKSSAYTYLAPKGDILSFHADSLDVSPSDYPNPYGESFGSGTLVKLYEYALAGGLKTNIGFDLYYRLNQLLPNIALPVRLYERRKGYKGHSMKSILNGLRVRLAEDRNNNIEEGFPSSFTFNGMKAELYAFKNPVNYIDQDGVLFTVNGQTHGALSSQFYNRKNVGMGAIANNILIIVNCDELSATDREDLFMNSRDRLRDGKIKNSIERELESYVNDHAGLKELRRRKREERIQSEQTESFKNAMQHIISQSHVLSALFLGNILDNPYMDSKKAQSQTFEGKQFPSYFTLLTNVPKPAHKNKKFRIQYSTDVTNDYFSRDNEAGELRVYLSGRRIDPSINIWNGVVSITSELPDCNVGDELTMRTELWDNSHVEPFVETFTVNVLPPKQVASGENGERKKPADTTKGDDITFKGKSGLPNIIEVRQDQWKTYNFGKGDCLQIINNGEIGYDFAINMDNQYLLSELVRANGEIEKLKYRYKYATSLIGMALIQSNMEDKATQITRGLSSVIIPITNI